MWAGIAEGLGGEDQSRGGASGRRLDARMPSRVASDGGWCGWQRGAAQGDRDRLPASVGGGTVGSRRQGGGVAAGRGRSGGGRFRSMVSNRAVQ